LEQNLIEREQSKVQAAQIQAREVVELFGIVAWPELRNKRFAAQPQSGEMFIARRARNDWQLGGAWLRQSRSRPKRRQAGALQRVEPLLGVQRLDAAYGTKANR